jgi:hypothetical protein
MIMKTVSKCLVIIAVLFAASADLTAGTIVSIDPGSAQLGQSIGAIIIGSGTHFEQASSMSIWLSQGSYNIYAYGYYPYDDTSLIVWFDIPSDAETGLYDLKIHDDIDGTMTLSNGFMITPCNIVSIGPNGAQQGETLSVAITGQNTHFTQGTYFQQGSVTTVWFSQGSPTCAKEAWAVDDTLLIAEFAFPIDAEIGLYDLNVYNDIDGTITLYNGFTITPLNPMLASITPNGAYQGQRLSVTITGRNTHFRRGTDIQQGTSTTTYWFSQGSPTTFAQATPTVASVVLLTQGSSTIYSEDGGSAGDELLMARFHIPADANAGLWDVVIPTRLDGRLTLTNGFTVAQPGDWTGDGKVNFFDLAVVADNWLEGTGE